VFDWLRRLFQRQPSDPFATLDTDRARLIVGLGNPGTEYAATRHNLGFRAVDDLAQRRGAAWVAVAESLIATGDGLVLAKPQTYMNRSGRAVRALSERLGLPLERALIVYDDMDLPFGALRLRERGSPGTHNGMRSVVAEVESENVPRLRIGISQAQPGAATDHVLSGFSADEEAEVDELVRRAADAAQTWATEGATVAMNRYNRL
jgi:peptidyl-tRNA hydrolase, PTH1 family